MLMGVAKTIEYSSRMLQSTQGKYIIHTFHVVSALEKQIIL